MRVRVLLFLSLYSQGDIAAIFDQTKKPVPLLSKMDLLRAALQAESESGSDGLSFSFDEVRTYTADRHTHTPL